MPAEQYFNQFSDQKALRDEKKKVIALLEEVEAKMKELSKQGVKINFSNSIKEINQAIRELDKTVNTLSVVRKEYAVTSAKVIQLKQREAQSTKELTRNEALDIEQRKQKNKELKLEAQLRLAAMGSLERNELTVKRLKMELGKLNLTTQEGIDKQKVINAEIERYNSIIAQQKGLAGAKTPEVKDVPFTTNLDQLEKEKQALSDVGDVINDVDREQVEAAISANEWADAQRKAAEAAEETKNVDLGGGVTKYKDELERLTGTLAENEELLKLHKKELDGVQSEMKLLEKTTSTSEKSTDRYRQKMENLRATETKLKNEIKDLSKTIKNQNIDQTAAAGSIDQMRARYALLLREIERGGTAFKNSSAGKIIIAEAVQVKTALDKAEVQVKNFKGSLSNTGTAITGMASKAFGFLRNIAYLIPGLGLAGLIGIIIEPIEKLIKSMFNAEKAMERLKAKSDILKEALKEGGYKDAIKNVNELRVEIDLAKQGFISKGDVVKHYNETIGQTTGKVNSLEAAEKALQANAEAYVKFTLLKAAANLALEKAAQKVLDQQEASLKDAQDFLTFGNKLVSFSVGQQTAAPGGFVPGQKTPAELAADKAAYEAEVAEKNRKKVIDRAKKDQDTLENIAKELFKQAGELSKKFKFNFFQHGGDKSDKSDKKVKTFYDELLQIQKKRLLEIASDEDKFFKQRIAARIAAYDIDKRIIQGKLSDDVKNAKGNKEEIKRLYAVAGETIYDLAVAKNKDIGKLNQDFLNNLKSTQEKGKKIASDGVKYLNEQLKKELEAQGRASADQYEVDQQDLENRYKEDLLALDKKFEKGKISEKNYNKARLKIEQEYQVALLKLQTEFAEEQLKIQKALANLEQDPEKKKERLAEIESAESKLNAARIKIAELLFSFTKKKNNDTKDNFIKTFEDIKNAAEIAFNTIGGFISAAAERDKNRIQEQIDLLDKQEQKDIEVAEQTIQNAQLRQEAIDRIQAKAAAQRRIYEIEQRQAEERNARFQKAATIAQIILNTSLAVMKALTEGDPYTKIPRALAAGAIGAAQLAVAIATPIPKYAEGTNSSEAGPALVAEEGRELAIDKYGKLTLYEKPTITNLIGGTKILPNKVSEDILKSNKGVHVMTHIKQDKPLDRTDEVLVELRAIKKNRQKILIVNKAKIETEAYYLSNIKGK